MYGEYPVEKKKRNVIIGVMAVCIMLLTALFATASAAESALEAEAKPYTIAWLSDTQRYSKSYPETFKSMTKYLARQKETLNLGYVVHTGDLVHNASKREQWRNARNALRYLEGIPYGVLAGNHDKDDSIGYTNYQKYFGKDKFEKKAHYGNSPDNNLSHYDLIRLGNTKYVFVYLSYQPDAEQIIWANKIFQKFPNRIGILCVHDYINTDSTLRSMGERLQKEIVEPNANVYMVLCGHRYTEDTLIETYDDDGDGLKDRTVYQCANYQTLKKGGSGYIRFLEMDEEAGTIRYYTYSPSLKRYRNPPNSAKNHAQEMPMPWLL